MPELGESVHEGTVSRWLKQVGDTVKEDEPVVEIMTDKVNTELQAPAAGTLVKILIPEGGSVEVFKAMGLIAEPGETWEDGEVVSAPSNGAVAAASSASTPTESVTSEQTAAPGGRRWYSPVVRAIARERGLTSDQLAGIAGSGAGGRVTKKDLEAYLAGGSAPMTTPASPRMEPKAPASVPHDGQQIVPLVGMRKMIAEAMVRASQVPTVSTLAEVDVTTMVRFRERNKDTFQEQFGVKFTYTPFFIKALTECLLEFPIVNAALMPDDKIVMNGAVHMGVAVSLGAKGDEGLIVPVIRDCQAKSLIELAKELETIAAKARGNQLSVADVQGGTFTLTNPGSYGAVLGTPMINAPQAAIIGTYAIKKVPVIVDEMIAVRSVMNLVLTYDHRLIDGLMAGRFLQAVKNKLETFDFFK